MSDDADVLNPVVDYHRNGVSGRGFYVVAFDTIVSGQTRHFVATMPSDPEWGECFVLDRDMLAEGNITFGQNSWRGDHYMPGVIDAVNAHRKAQDEKWGIETTPIVVLPFWERES